VEDKVFDIRFVALVTEEFRGSFKWDGEEKDALQAVQNYLFGIHGKDKFKIIEFGEADGDRDPSQLIVIPPTPENSKDIH